MSYWPIYIKLKRKHLNVKEILVFKPCFCVCKFLQTKEKIEENHPWVTDAALDSVSVKPGIGWWKRTRFGYHSEEYLFLPLNSKIWISFWGVFVFDSEDLDIILGSICFWVWRYEYHYEVYLFLTLKIWISSWGVFVFYSEDLDIILRSICFRKVWISFWGVFVFDSENVDVILRRIFLLKFKVFGKQT